MVGAAWAVWILLAEAARSELVVIGVSKAHVAGLPAVRAIIQAVDAKTHVISRLAEAAVLLASAFGFRFVALRAQSDHFCCPFLQA